MENITRMQAIAWWRSIDGTFRQKSLSDEFCKSRVISVQDVSLTDREIEEIWVDFKSKAASEKMTFDTIIEYMRSEYGGKFLGYNIFRYTRTGRIGWATDNSDTYIFATPNWDGGDITPFEVVNRDGDCIRVAEIRFTHKNTLLNFKLYFTILALIINGNFTDTQNKIW
jgi:hypothetical protein